MGELTEAAKLAPGRPSTNCVWRWCRKGVHARNGQRIKLQHIRVGGKIFTTHGWMDEFGRKLAEADAQYFDDCAEPDADVQVCSRSAGKQVVRAEIERELDEAGI